MSPMASPVMENMPVVDIFGFRGSPYVEKVIAALNHKGLAWTLHNMKSPGEMKRRNPVTGKMPVVTIDGERVIDSTLILRRLEELQPQPAMWATDTAVAARQRLLEDWCDESLYWYIMALRWQPANAPQAIAQITSALPGFVAGPLGWLLKRKLKQATWAQGLGRLPLTVLVEQTQQVLQDLSAQLGERDYFFADSPGAADFAVYGELVFGLSGSTPEFEQALQNCPGLLAFYERIKAIKGQ